jgi:GH24 family phage-related lysozyme (muramidase)
MRARASVVDRFVPFSVEFEGAILTMYCDVLGYVTVGIGNLINTVADAQRCLFVHRVTRAPATQAEIAREWQMMHANRDVLGRQGWTAAARVATLELTMDGLDNVVFGKLHEVDADLTRHFPEYPAWNASAQLATISMVWAMGGAFFGTPTDDRFPRWEAAMRRQDFAGAALQCRMKEDGNPGLVPRNRANKLLFETAAKVRDVGSDPDVLHYPRPYMADESIVTDDNRPVFIYPEHDDSVRTPPDET